MRNYIPELTEKTIKFELDYLISEGFIKVFIGPRGEERYRLKTNRELMEEIGE